MQFARSALAVFGPGNLRREEDDYANIIKCQCKLHIVHLTVSLSCQPTGFRFLILLRAAAACGEYRGSIFYGMLSCQYNLQPPKPSLHICIHHSHSLTFPTRFAPLCLGHSVSVVSDAPFHLKQRPRISTQKHRKSGTSNFYEVNVISEWLGTASNYCKLVKFEQTSRLHVAQLNNKVAYCNLRELYRVSAFIFIKKSQIAHCACCDLCVLPFQVSL